VIDWRREYQAYLFDLDGTLIDTAPDINVALNHSLEHFDFQPVSESHTRHWIGYGGRVLLQQALEHQGFDGDIEAQLDTMLQPFLDYYSEHHAAVSTIYPTVEETLARLRARGAKLAVVTNKISRLSIQILDTLNLTSYFDLIVCGDTTPTPKPDPAPVRYCLDRFDIAPQSTLFVGDSITDVSAARAAGTAIVCVRDGYNHGDDVATLDVDGVIDLFADIP
jgi:phosphoglycolate phosphatase